MVVIGQQLGFVTHADLLELDAGVELAGHVAHQLAEVHPSVGPEVEDDLLAAQDVLDLDDAHLQLVLAHQLHGLHHLLGGQVVVDVTLPGNLLLGRTVHHRAGDVRVILLGHLGHDRPQLEPPVGPDDHAGAAVVRVVRVERLEVDHGAVSDQVNRQSKSPLI